MFLDEEQVGKKTALAFIGEGRVVPEIEFMPDYGERFLNSYWHGKKNVVPKEYHSSLYQWLPANVAFRDDGTTEFTSYINNLHPEKYPAIYEAIEHAIDTALPAWDQCLRKNVNYRHEIVAGRSDSRFELLSGVRCVSPSIQAIERVFVCTDGCLSSDGDEHLWTESMTFGVPDDDDEPDETGYVRTSHFDTIRYRWRPVHTSVGPLLSPGEWVQGREAILPEPEEFEEIDYTPRRRLRKMFKEHGLQVIVKMASIELTPEKPHFPSGSWHVSCLCPFLLSIVCVRNTETRLIG